MIIIGTMPALPFDRKLGFLVLMVLGAVWTSAMSLTFRTIVDRFGSQAPAGATPRQPTFHQKFDRWKRIMRTWEGWNYAVRLGVCLILAFAIERLWPDHHLHWVGLTIALLTSRKAETTTLKTTQRVLGTAIGVLLAWLGLRSGLPAWGLVVATGVLAGARSLLRGRHYLAYSVVMTPLVMLIIDSGQPPELALLIDRLMATALGGLLVVIVSRVGRLPV